MSFKWSSRFPLASSVDVMRMLSGLMSAWTTPSSVSVATAEMSCRRNVYGTFIRQYSPYARRVHLKELDVFLHGDIQWSVQNLVDARALVKITLDLKQHIMQRFAALLKEEPEIVLGFNDAVELRNALELRSLGRGRR